MLTRDGNHDYLVSLKNLLEENGIPSVIQGTETARMIIPTFLLEPTLWVYFDEQFEDASRLIIDNEHVVTTGISIEDFYNNQPNKKEQNSIFVNELGNLAAYVILVILIMVVITAILAAQ